MQFSLLSVLQKLTPGRVLLRFALLDFANGVLICIARNNFKLCYKLFYCEFGTDLSSGIGVIHRLVGI